MQRTAAHDPVSETTTIRLRGAAEAYPNDAGDQGDSRAPRVESPPSMRVIGPDLDVAGEHEISLVSAAKEGDVSSFETLVRRHDRMVFRIARQITNNNEDAEDVVQTAFLKAFRGISGFKGMSRFSTWLFRITVNEALMKVRQRHGIQAISIDADDEHDPAALHGLVDWRPNPEQIYSQSELRDILAKALEDLSLRYRTVFLLRDVEGLSTNETAEVLNLSVATVKSPLFRARLKLRTRLGLYFQVQSGQENG